MYFPYKVLSFSNRIIIQHNNEMRKERLHDQIALMKNCITMPKRHWWGVCCVMFFWKGRFLMCIVNAHCNCFRHTAISKFKIVLSDDEEESWAAMYYTVCVWLCDTLLDTHFILSVETRTLLRENASFNCIVMSQALKLCVLMYIAVFWCILQIKHQLHLSICRMEFCLDSGWTKYHREVSRCLLEPREWITCWRSVFGLLRWSHGHSLELNSARRCGRNRHEAHFLYLQFEYIVVSDTELAHAWCNRVVLLL